MDYDKITKALKTMTPEQIQMLMEEFASAMRAEGNVDLGPDQLPQQPQMMPPESLNPGPIHPTQTPDAIVRQQMMRQPMGILNRGY